MSTFDGKGEFSVLKKSQARLLQKTFPSAFQAYDEGSIPFTRSNPLRQPASAYRAMAATVSQRNPSPHRAI
jgi:hypothetical protein